MGMGPGGAEPPKLRSPKSAAGHPRRRREGAPSVGPDPAAPQWRPGGRGRGADTAGPSVLWPRGQVQALLPGQTPETPASQVLRAGPPREGTPRGGHSQAGGRNAAGPEGVAAGEGARTSPGTLETMGDNGKRWLVQIPAPELCDLSKFLSPLVPASPDL